MTNYRIEGMMYEEQQKDCNFYCRICFYRSVGVSSVSKRERKNPEAQIRIGAGDDVSGILMEETVENLGEEYAIYKELESTSFQDC